MENRENKYIIRISEENNKVINLCKKKNYVRIEHAYQNTAELWQIRTIILKKTFLRYMYIIMSNKNELFIKLSSFKRFSDD